MDRCNNDTVTTGWVDTSSCPTFSSMFLDKRRSVDIMGRRNESKELLLLKRKDFKMITFRRFPFS
jgi:hypothetical protein